MAPRVSVIVRTYNRAALVAESLRSVSAQTERDLEILVVDDGSTDDTVRVVEAHARTDSRVRLVRRDHLGPAAALNAGVREARGEFLAFLDSDDLWEPASVERRLEVLRANPSCGAALVDWSTFGPGPRRPSPSDMGVRETGDLLLTLFRVNFFSLCAALVPARVVAEVGPFDEDLGASEDYDWGLRIAARHPIAFVPQALLRYRSHENHIMTDPRMYRFRCRVLERFAAAHADRLPRPLVRDRLAESHTQVGGAFLAAGEFREARRHFLRALRHRPLRPVVWKALARAILGLRPRDRMLR